MQHYESRRKGRLELVRKEREKLMEKGKEVYRASHATRKERVEVVEVEDKLQKKKMMDDIRRELKHK